MYEVPSWKEELRRRLAELRERASAAVREPAKAAVCAPAAGAGRNAGRRNSPARQRKRWQR